MTDPNAKVSGNGFEKLRQAGIRVDVGLLEPEARKLNEAFIHFHTTGLPHITLKVAATLDGKIATRTGESKWITGDKARLFVHILRGQSSAIMVGVGTVIADDPSLRCRLPRVPRQPLRVVLDPTLRIPHNCQLVNSACDIPTLVVHGKGADPAHIDILQSKNVELLAVELSESGLDLYSLFAELARRQIVSVLVEGGSYTSSTLLRGGFVDRLLWFIAPKLLGGQESIGAVGGLSPEWINDALALDQLQARRFGDDLLLETRPKRLPSVVR
jgi:diaminohydroxyphosphoribosylaminopyrimidine deaminase/5-amino-6-(5-phosphoribosylamino)uracil reductase